MKQDLNFEDTSTKKLLTKLSFEYFLMENVQREQYNQSKVDEIFRSYRATRNQIKSKGKKHKAQFFYFCEGEVRKMFKGGLLPALFGLDETRELKIVDLVGVGNNWAYFDFWKRCYKKRQRRAKFWDIIIKVGSILGILLSIIKFLEFFNLINLTL